MSSLTSIRHTSAFVSFILIFVDWEILISYLEHFHRKKIAPIIKRIK